MAVGAVLTQGLGAFGGVNQLPLLGLFPDTASATDYITTRITLIGTSQQRLALTGTSQQRVGLTGTSQERLTLRGNDG